MWIIALFLQWQRFGGTELGEKTGALLSALQPLFGITQQARKACCSIVVLTGANAPCSAARSLLAPNYTTTLHTYTETEAQELRDRNRYTETWQNRRDPGKKLATKLDSVLPRDSRHMCPKMPATIRRIVNIRCRSLLLWVTSVLMHFCCGFCICVLAFVFVFVLCACLCPQRRTLGCSTAVNHPWFWIGW